MDIKTHMRNKSPKKVQAKGTTKIWNHHPIPSITNQEGIGVGETCVHTMAQYWINYNKDMIEAYKNKLINAIYQIERTDGCKVARLTKMIGNETHIVRPESAEKVSMKCTEQDDSKAHETSTGDEVANRRNRGLVELNWNDLHTRDGESLLIDQLIEMTVYMGYENPKEH